MSHNYGIASIGYFLLHELLGIQEDFHVANSKATSGLLGGIEAQ